MDQISEQRLAAVYPGLAARVRTLADILAREGIAIRVTAGLRTVAEQDALYAQGRTAPGPVVTNVRGGRSYHNFGMAVDCVPSAARVGEPFEPDWNHTHPAWQRMIEVARGLGLECGADWMHFKDWPHLEMTGKWPVGEPPEVALELEGGAGGAGGAGEGLEKVWEAAYA